MIDVIPLAGMVTGVIMVMMIGFTVIRVFQGPVGQALGRRIHGGTAGDEGTLDALHDMQERVEQLEARLVETEDRLDFAERLLAAPPAEK